MSIDFSAISESLYNGKVEVEVMAVFENEQDRPPNSRPTGINLVENLPWGAHVCLFFETDQDLLNLQLPYLKAGLEEGEACVWVISDQFTKEQMISELGKTVSNLPQRLARGDIEILTHREWYLKNGTFDFLSIVNGCKNKLRDALARGYAGLRATGDGSWIQGDRERDSFRDYERELNRLLCDQKVLLLCAFQLSRSDVATMVDVGRCHRVTLAHRNGRLDVLEAADFEEDDPDMTLKAIASYASEIALAIRRHSAEELLHQQPGAELEQRALELRRALDDVEHFSRTITHDLRAPLRAISGFSELLTSRTESLLPEESADLLERIKRSAQKMDQLIEDALEFSRMTSQNLSIGPVDSKALIEEIIAFSPELQPPRAFIRVEELPIVVGNCTGLRQVYSNLMANAVKFVEPGKVPRLRIYAEGNGERVRICFQDNGIGISEEVRSRLFHVFQRGTTEYPGTGLGLALAKRAAERMGGRIGVESEPGKGSRFWIELPVRER